MKQRAAQAWPLWSIIAAQVVLILPWLWRTAPFTDEALYLDAGHHEWAHWLHHAALPDYASWFSGAPVLYPPLGAAADSAGGLAAARGVSLVLMAGATALVYLAGTRLFGRYAGLFAAALLAVSGLAVHYGAFATYDALALFFLTLAVWTAVRAGQGGYRWLAACAVSLALANAAKYATLPFDLVMPGIALLHGRARQERMAALLAEGLLLVAVVAGLDAGLLVLGGPEYAHGVAVTTAFRTIHWYAPSTASSVFWRAFAMTGLVVVTGVLGVAVSAARKNRLPVTGLLALLVLAALIVPADQARIHQLSSLDKNLGFGLPFAALAAGYAISACAEWRAEAFPAARLAGYTAGAVLVLLALIAGRRQVVQFQGPSKHAAARIVAAISHGYRPGTYILTSDARMEQYYLPQIPAPSWKPLNGTPAAGLSRFRTEICTGRVSLVVLKVANPRTAPRPSHAVPLLRTSHFWPIVTVGRGSNATQVWQRRAPAQKAACR